MSQINTNINSLIAQRVLGQQQSQLSTSLERLSTGMRINSGKDDPAGLIASQSMAAQQNAITAAIGNAQRADQVASTAEGGLQQVSSMLLSLQSLVDQSASSAGLSEDEKNANQQQIDAILQSIDRIASTTSFNGTKLLNGSLDFQISGQNSKISDLQVNQAAFTSSMTVNAVVTASAQHGGLVMSMASSSLDLTSSVSRFTFEVAGTDGSRQFSFSSGAKLSSMAAQINSYKDVLGVSASVVSGAQIHLKSTDFGSNAFVSVSVSDDAGQGGTINTFEETDEDTVVSTAGTAFSAVTNAIRDEGQDVGAIVNGVTAKGDGLKLAVNSDAIAADLTLTSGAAHTIGAFSAFTIAGGGAKFNLGPEVNLGNQVTLGIGNVSTRNLGNSTLGFLSDLASGQDDNIVDGDTTAAQKVVNEAITQVATLRGRIGSFQSNVVTTTVNSLNVALENISAARSAITDTDFASETAQLTRSQILVQAATSALKIANAQPNSILQLLQ